jgi:hypothetical protein
MWIVTVGAKRFERLYGPFEDFETAERWVKAHRRRENMPHIILPLYKPAERKED